MAKVRSFNGILKKPIDLRKTPWLGICRQLRLPPDKEAMRNYLKKEFAARFIALDEFFSLDSTAPNIWEQRAKALMERTHGVPPSGADWWKALTEALVNRHLPGFTVNISGRQRGAPQEWTFLQLNELLADIEFLQKNHRISIKKLCQKLPRSKGYARRWGKYTPESLYKQYTRAKAQQELTSGEFRAACALKLVLS